jgi:hypothetical protein
MQDSLAGVGCFGVAVALIVGIYPLLALGRIWLYSMQQAQTLLEIKELLQQRS